tara:strand:+ start:362 stop:532 length:171 start_codon:yes stop_codon:yes gene_type:complete
VKVGDLVLVDQDPYEAQMAVIVWGGKSAIKVQFINEPHKQVWVSAEYMKVLSESKV